MGKASTEKVAIMQKMAVEATVAAKEATEAANLNKEKNLLELLGLYDTSIQNKRVLLEDCTCNSDAEDARADIKNFKRLRRAVVKSLVDMRPNEEQESE